MSTKEIIFETTKAIIAVGLVGGAIYLAIVEKEVPSWLYGFVGIVIGSYFNAVAAWLSKRM